MNIDLKNKVNCRKNYRQTISSEMARKRKVL